MRPRSLLQESQVVVLQGTGAVPKRRAANTVPLVLGDNGIALTAERTTTSQVISFPTIATGLMADARAHCAMGLNFLTIIVNILEEPKR
eukprot:CAMPEP_0194509940 /NCGR_PEP_ID=MMETSP0253-20130528/41196_1 /TAXON_ID=2966 /ORGANISM="Noctiluca scintillans" /LENGTH=88 /DNA_ID=CAMNT_0039353147 /DNA_START=475 /DNA_END=737 /DNA_ORIENTATION=-